MANSNAFWFRQLAGGSIVRTLSAVLLLGIFPALLMGSYFVSSSLSNIDIANRQLKGLALLREIQPVDDFLTNPPVDADMRKAKAGFALTKFERAVAADNRAVDLKVAGNADAVARTLKVFADGKSVNAFQAFDAMVIRIGDTSGLVLDPELESSYLMDLVVHKNRRLARAERELFDTRTMPAEYRDRMRLVLRHRVSEAANDLNASYLSVLREDEGALEAGKFGKAFRELIKASNLLIADKDGKSANHAIFIDASRASWTASADALQHALEARRGRIIAEMYVALGICGLALILVILLGGIMVASIGMGLRNISQRVQAMSQGDYDSEVPGVDFGNDIGVIAGALQEFIVMRGQLDAERARAEHELETTVAKIRTENEGLLAATLEQQRSASDIERATVAKLATDLEQQVFALLEGSRQAAGKMDVEAADMADRSAEVQREASSASAAAAEIRRTMAQVPQNIGIVARQLDDYTVSLGEANSLAVDAVKRVAIANRRMGDFAQATSKAAAMLELIRSVSQKTNMLALNASIEAVRVGEAGKGFQVVANEVKALALSTRDAASEIAQQIGAMESVNREVAGAFDEVLRVVDTLAEQSASVSAGMDAQARAMGSVESTVIQATTELASMIGSIETADRSATATRQRSFEMLAASRGVSDNVGALDVSVREFLGGLRKTQRRAA